MTIETNPQHSALVSLVSLLIVLYRLRILDEPCTDKFGLFSLCCDIHDGYKVSKIYSQINDMQRGPPIVMRDLEVIDNPILVEVLNDQGIIDDILQTYAVV